jgi:ATP-binding cassette subfamily B protein
MRFSDLRCEKSVLFQDYAQYNLTLAENIWLAMPDGPLDMGKVAKAAKDSGADRILKGLMQVMRLLLANGSITARI